MTEYEYHYEMFNQDETVDIPEDAVGITVDSSLDQASVRYLLPVDREEGR